MTSISQDVLLRTNSKFLERLTYEIKPQFIDGRKRYKCTTTCSKCHRTEESEWTQSGNTPELVAKLWHKRGWDFSVMNYNRVVCPTCKTTRRMDRMKHSHLIEQPNSVPGPMPKSKTDTSTIALSMANRRLSNEERMQVRRLLDQHFDDKDGVYLAGYDDKKIGAELAVPWALVAELRETAYGPIREDPVIAKLKQEFDSLRDDLDTLRAKVGNALKRLEEHSK